MRLCCTRTITRIRSRERKSCWTMMIHRNKFFVLLFLKNYIYILIHNWEFFNRWILRKNEFGNLVRYFYYSVEIWFWRIRRWFIPRISIFLFFEIWVFVCNIYSSSCCIKVTYISALWIYENYIFIYRLSLNVYVPLNL